LIRASVDDIPTQTSVANPAPKTVETRAIHRAPKPAATRPVTAPAAASDTGIPASGHPVSPPRPPVKRLRLFWPITVSLGAGIAAIAAGDFTYQASARFLIDGNVDHCRRELLDMLWRKASAGQLDVPWRVIPTTSDNTIEARITLPTATAALETMTAIGDQFKARLTERTQAGRQDADEATRLLDEFIATAREDADQARSTVQEADRAIADASPFHTRETLRTEIANEVESVHLLRTAKANVEARLTRIDTDPIPTEGWVSPAMKQEAYAARSDLDQDIKQLDFQLNLSRRLLEDVWQEASPRLDELIAASARLARIGLSDEARSTTGPERRTVDDLLSRAGDYQRRLTAFAQEWTETFTGMRRHAVDPLAARVLATQSHLHDLLGDFLFNATKVIDDMRADVERLTQQTHGSAGYHELHSQVKTAYYRFESEHRQFELVASKVLCRNNFRLDAGIKSAAGLHRRTQQIIAAIEAELEEAAIATAIEERKKERKQVVAELEQIRTGLDAAIDKIIALQAEFLLTIPQSDRYLESRITAGAARDRLTDIESRIAERQAMAKQLKSMSSVMPQLGTVTSADYSVDRTPANLLPRFGWGLTAAFATFALTLLLTLRNLTRPWA